MKDRKTALDPEEYRPHKGTTIRDATASEELSEKDVERIVEDVRTAAGRPSLSSAGTSPSFNLRMSAATRSRLDEVASDQGRRPGEIVREALEQYLASH